MIPRQLTLKNFLSYREATLDFRGLHVACICGANGAGKSSLLEAIAWVIWGESRVSTDDDVIHLGETEARADFIFQCHQQTYRILRSRHRGQMMTLEFQVETPQGFRSLTQKGVRATQQLILHHLKLDYETFVNSAYLRQGRADEFMLKRPGDRKQILTDLLKLNQYDVLAEQAKEQVRDLKAELQGLQRNLEAIATQLEQRETLVIEEGNLRVALGQRQQQQEADQQRLRQLQALQQQYQGWQQQYSWQQQQQQDLSQDCQQLQQELAEAQTQQQQVENILQEAEAIAVHYARFQRLQAEEELLSAKFQTYQTTQVKLQDLQQRQLEQANSLKEQLRQAQLQLEHYQQQQQENQHILSKAHDIETGLAQLRQARQRLAEFDRLQVKAVPLMQRRQQIQTELDRYQARLIARLETVRSQRQQLETEHQRYPQLQQQLARITQQVAYLEERREYQQQVREKGVERRNFLERLQERQREYEQELNEINQKIELLTRTGDETTKINIQISEGQTLEIGDRSQPNIVHETTNREQNDNTHNQTTTSVLVEAPTEVSSPYAIFHAPPPHPPSSPSTHPPTPYPPCPLCDRPLDEHHWQHVLEHHQEEKEEIQTQLWVIREQLTTSDREIRVLRQEYRDVEKELSKYGGILERRGQLQQQLQGVVTAHQQLQQVMAEQALLERSLQQGDYGLELQEELRLLDRTLQQLNYDDKNHALTRGECDRWRWAEIKAAELRQAQRRQAQLAEKQPQVEAGIAELEQQLMAIATAPLQRQIQELEERIAGIGYNLDQHTHLRQTLKQAQPWQLRYQQLLQAQQQLPQLQQRSQDLRDRLHQRTQALQSLTTDLAALHQQLQRLPNPQAEIQTLEQQIQQRRLQLDDQIAHLGRLQAQQSQLEALGTQHSALNTQSSEIQRQIRIYNELAIAFGKNGIQALMIENVLPQLEAETNHILGRLSANQLHVQFVTQKTNRSARSKPQAAKLIETLDILISDLQGTRPYETYSGGEAFRVNFSIRLALARLLAQRSGMPLQLLIIDEGFGTQDELGCDRLISAINAIAPDFACILTVTHMPHLKEAFQTRIEVQKTNEGSQLRLLV